MRFGIGQSGQHPLLALQAKRVARVVLQHRQVKQRLVVGFMATDLPGRRDQALCNQVLRQSQLIQHFQRGRVEGGGPEVVIDAVGFVDHQGFYAGTGQAQPRHQTDRPGATDENRYLLHEDSIRLNECPRGWAKVHPCALPR